MERGLGSCRLVLNGSARDHVVRSTNERGPTRLGPKSTGAQGANHACLVTTGVAANQDLAVTRIAEGETRRPIVVGRASHHPAATNSPAAEDRAKRFSGHGAPPL